MAITSTTSEYVFNFSLNKGDTGVTQTVVFPVETGMTDGLAAAFAKAFRDLPWPQDTLVSTGVSWRELTDTQLDADLDTGTFA